MNQTAPRSRPIIEVKDIRKEYPIGDETVVALKRINLSVMRGKSAASSAPPAPARAPAQPAGRHGKAHPG